LSARIFRFEFLQRMHQGLGDVPPAVRAKSAMRIRQILANHDVHEDTFRHLTVSGKQKSGPKGSFD
jgi:hypothetical protein